MRLAGLGLKLGAGDACKEYADMLSRRRLLAELGALIAAPAVVAHLDGMYVCVADCAYGEPAIASEFLAMQA